MPPVLSLEGSERGGLSSASFWLAESLELEIVSGSNCFVGATRHFYMGVAVEAA